MPSLDVSFDKKIRKNTGSHYTPTNLSDFVAKKILTDFHEKHPTKKTIKIIDPAVGDGELLNSIVRLAIDQGYEDISVTGFDINAEAIQATNNLLKKYDDEILSKLHKCDFLDWVMNHSQNNLFSQSTLENYDVVIANPPYVRTQVLGAEKAQKLAKTFNLTGRVDLYYAFLIGIEKILSDKGVVGIIVSNRFLTTKSGESVRSHLSENFNISNIWDFGDTRLFKAAVLPAVLLMHKYDPSHKTDTAFTSIYLNQTKAVNPNDIFSTLENNETHESLKITHGTLGKSLNPKDVWFVSNEESDAWLAEVKKNTHQLFSDIGKVKVGVKTTADKVFIVDSDHEFIDGKPETLRPLTTHHIANRYRANQPIKHIVYTHEEVEGKKTAIDLNSYPKTRKYLESHFDTLDSRSYVKKSNRNWYEIWVPHNPADWDKPKLVFRDISEKPIFWLEEGGNIINGDCYWLTPHSDKNQESLWLALAVANSTFIEEFYDRKFNNKLYSGRRRFITQYVEKFPLPNPTTDTALEIVHLVKKIHSNPGSKNFEGDEHRISQLVYNAFGL